MAPMIRFNTPFGGIWIATLLLFLVCLVVAPGAVSRTALISMLPFAAILAITAVGQTLVVQQGGLDLSVPGMISLAALIVTRFPNLDDGLVIPGILLAVLACTVAGLISGLCVSFLSITPLVVTLAMNAFILGFVRWYSGGFPTGAVQSINQWAIGSTLGIPNTMVVAIIIIAVVTLVVKRSVIGRRFEAVGANSFAAQAAGIPVRLYVLGSYTAAGTLYAIAGVLLAAFLKTPSIFLGESYLLPTVAAVVLGGTALTGGVGSVVASAVAALFLTQLGQIVLSIGAPTSAQLLIQAATIAVGMGLRGISFRAVWARLKPPVLSKQDHT
ncbi:MAG: ABC transporter permease [Roseovarius sp.]|nr:ABC transporter permease [Roseovarius sp.]